MEQPNTATKMPNFRAGFWLESSFLANDASQGGLSKEWTDEGERHCF
jgi:hypothetical protein